MPAMQRDSCHSLVQLLPITGKYYRWCMVSIIMDNGINGMYCSHDPEDDLGLFTVPAPGRMRSPQHAVTCKYPENSGSGIPVSGAEKSDAALPAVEQVRAQAGGHDFLALEAEGEVFCQVEIMTRDTMIREFFP